MELRKTDDGSHTVWSEHFCETYHSTFGAVTESNHVFIEAGFRRVGAKQVTVFEMGFGTGLNAILTLKEAKMMKVEVIYHALELFPVTSEVYKNFATDPEFTGEFRWMHELEWNKTQRITPHFSLKKITDDLTKWKPENYYHLIYFDAFSPETQPELWTEEIFQKMYNMLYPGGILTTYCAKGVVRRNMISAGFNVERIPGPPGKREMLRATK